MISYDDCIALCGIDAETIHAISMHEHVPEIVASAMAYKLLRTAHGAEAIRHMIVEDIQSAHLRGDREETIKLLHCLKSFLEDHPEAIPATFLVARGDG